MKLDDYTWAVLLATFVVLMAMLIKYFGVQQ